MGLLSKLFGGGGGGGPVDGASEEYQSHTIIAAPTPRDGQYQTAGRILPPAGVDAEPHSFIRADVHPSREQAEQHSLQKGRQIIDENGAALFKR